jgi:PAS domain S-box-containing protein
VGAAAASRQENHVLRAETYRALFRRAADAIIVADATTGRIEAANVRAAYVTGRSADELRSLSYLDLFDLRTRHRLPLPGMQGEGSIDVGISDAEVVRPDGSRCPVDIALATVVTGEQTLLQAIMRDSTARRQQEMQLTIRHLEEQNAELRAAQARLVEHDRVRTEFLGMMSHELRSPVNILIGYAHMLLESTAAGDTLPAAERAGILRRMVAGGHTLSELVEDTLSALRLDAGAVHVGRETIALDQLFHDLKGNDRLLRGPDAVEERWIVEPDVPEITTDRRKLRQIITNLVGNARKFTTAGHIEVRATAPSPERVRITVTDTGCGISAEHLPNIFELYRQAPNGQAHDGCGIGLYIVRRYLDMLQGSVECTSTLGEGTVFTIELPRCTQAGDTAADPLRSGHAVAPAN